MRQLPLLEKTAGISENVRRIGVVNYTERGKDSCNGGEGAVQGHDLQACRRCSAGCNMAQSALIDGARPNNG